MDLSETYIIDLVKINPDLNDFAKIDDLDNLEKKVINTFSPEYNKKESELTRKYIELLKNKKHLTTSEELLKIDLQRLFKQVDFPDIYFPITPLNNYFIERISEISGTGNFFKFIDKSSYIHYINRLKLIPNITKVMIHNLTKGMKHNMTYPKRLVLQLILQLHEAIINNTKKNKYNHKNKIPPSILSKFLNAIDNDLIKSMKTLAVFLMTKYLPKSRDTIGLRYLKNGRELYNEYVKEYTYQNYNAVHVHKIGIKYTEIWMNKLLELKMKMNNSDNLHNFFTYMEDHGKNKFNDKKKLFNYLNTLKKRIYQDTFLPNFKDKIDDDEMYLVKSVPNGNKSMSAYYQLPDLDNETKGTFYFNTHELDKINKDELLVLSVHEGNPGHHYEYLYHNRNNKSLYKKFTTYSTYSEGWALYCELLTQPKNDYEYFWMIIYSLHRAIRLVVDTGIHWYGWSYEESYMYMKERLPFDNKMIKDEIYRYIDDPGQALCYTIGCLCILDLRKKYLEKSTDIKLFHELILKIGPCHLDFLKKEFDKIK
tara:strand:+ start:4670 stop:6283 length:1614 start_codon:yes stop_codon:yes gene_type:complete